MIPKIRDIITGHLARILWMLEKWKIGINKFFILLCLTHLGVYLLINTFTRKFIKALLILFKGKVIRGHIKEKAHSRDPVFVNSMEYCNYCDKNNQKPSSKVNRSIKI